MWYVSDGNAPEKPTFSKACLVGCAHHLHRSPQSHHSFCIFHFADNELVHLGSDTPTFKVGVYFESNEPGYFILELNHPHLCWYIVSARVCDLFALSRVRVRVDQIE